MFRVTGMPLSRITDLNRSLSIASAEAVDARRRRTGTPASSSSPCTVPSSPKGPCSTGNTTSTSASRRDDRLSRQPPLELRSRAIAAARRRAARAPTRPSRPISIGSTSAPRAVERRRDAARRRRPRSRARSSGRPRGPRSGASRSLRGVRRRRARPASCRRSWSSVGRWSVVGVVVGCVGVVGVVRRGRRVVVARGRVVVGGRASSSWWSSCVGGAVTRCPTVIVTVEPCCSFPLRRVLGEHEPVLAAGRSRPAGHRHREPRLLQQLRRRLLVVAGHDSGRHELRALRDAERDRRADGDRTCPRRRALRDDRCPPARRCSRPSARP